MMKELIILFIILAAHSVVPTDPYLEPVTGIYSIERKSDDYVDSFACHIDMVTGNSTCVTIYLGIPMSKPEKMDYFFGLAEFRIFRYGSSTGGDYFYYQRIQEEKLHDRGGLYIAYDYEDGAPAVYSMLSLPNGTVVIAWANRLAFTQIDEYSITYYGQYLFPTDYVLVPYFSQPHIFVYEEDLDTFIVQLQKKEDVQGVTTQLARVHVNAVLNTTLHVELLPVVKPLGLLWKYNGKFIGYMNGTFSWVDVDSGDVTPFLSLSCPGAPDIDWDKGQIYHVTICEDKQMLEIVNFDGTNHIQVVNPGLVNTRTIGLSHKTAGCSQPCVTHDDCTGVCNICRLKQCVDTGDCGAYCNIDGDCYACSSKCVNNQCVR